MNSFKRYKKIFFDTLSIYAKYDMSAYAGYATLYILTALFPMIMLIISVVNMLPGYSAESVSNYILSFLPNIPSVRNLISGMFINIQSQSTGLLASVAGLTALWSASGGITAIQKGLKKLAGTSAYDIRKNKLLALIYTFFFVILVPTTLLFQVLGSTIVDLTRRFASYIGAENIISTISSIVHFGAIISVIIGLLVVLLTYTFLPKAKMKMRDQLPGTVFTGYMWFIFTKLFGYFIPKFYKSSGLYGSLASLFITLLWLRFIIMILFYGGALNRALMDEKNEAKRAAAEPEIPE